MKRAVLFLAIVAALAIPARAWDPVGHMIVNQIAYDHLTPAAKARVDKSVAAFNAKNQTNYTFVSAGCWMDDIRGRTKDYNTWHYIDLPYNLEGEPFPVDWQVNALWGIRLCTDIITGKRTEPGIDKDQALVMLSHMVGDIHQPLHTSNRDDAGGNKVDVPNLQDPKTDLFPHWKNLHTFWDTSYRRKFENGKVVELLLEPPYTQEEPIAGHNAAAPVIREQADAFQKNYSSEKYPATGDPVFWIKESHRTGYTEAYQKLPGGDASNPVELDAAYVDNARGISQQKLVQGGLRLAALLNEIYK